MSIFIGSGVALCTPFDKQGKFNGDVYAKLIKFHSEKGTAAIISCGTTGEASTLSESEHVEVVKTAVTVAKKYNIPVIAGAGGNDTAKCCEMGKKLQKLGVAALMYTTPYYNKTSQAGIIAHYTKIATSVEVPIVVYNVPIRTAVNILPETYEELSKIRNIEAVKEASGDIDQIASIIALCGDDLDVYTGNDGHILPTLSLGGKGVISTVANIAPKRVHDLASKYFDGDILSSRALQLSLMRLVKLLFSDISPMPVKAALNLMGYNAGECRLPLVSISRVLLEEIRHEMEECGLI